MYLRKGYCLVTCNWQDSLVEQTQRRSLYSYTKGFDGFEPWGKKLHILFTCFLPQSLGCKPIASIDHFTPEMMATAELVEEVSLGTSKVVKVTGITNPGQSVSILVRGSNKLVLEEAERSLHDALCVVRCLVKKR